MTTDELRQRNTPGRAFRIAASSVYYAMRFDVDRGAWRRASTREADLVAAAKVAERWKREGDRARSLRVEPRREALGQRTKAAATRRARTADRRASSLNRVAAPEPPASSITALIDDYITFRRNSADGPKDRHLTETRRLLRRLLVEAGWREAREIDLGSWQAAMAAVASAEPASTRGTRRPGAGRRRGDAERPSSTPMADLERTRRGREASQRLSNNTLNHYRAAWKAFTKWAHNAGEIEKNPLAGLVRYRTAGFERRRRLALSVEGFRRLFASVSTSDVTRAGLDGRARAMLYLVAVCSGFRRGELAALEPASLRRGADGRLVAHLPAWATKNGETATQPMLPDVEAAMAWVASRPARTPLWPGLGDLGAAAMLQADARAAGVATSSPDGRRLDFHSLRRTFGTWLVTEYRVHPKLAQELMRHSSVELTMMLYTEVDAADLGASIGRQVGAVNPRKLAQTDPDGIGVVAGSCFDARAVEPMESGIVPNTIPDCESDATAQGSDPPLRALGLGDARQSRGADR
ncbi:MAG TPA: site-specific integrase [Phycisphaerales bacterium]|nr:site-specific integrase [Phycisphaerales bacterium]HMP37103.1 site-specific integrase [Phycisphaerales bacterium]